MGRSLQRRRRNPGATAWIHRHRWWLLAAGAAGAGVFAWPYLEADVPQWLPLNRLTGGAKVDDTDAPAGDIARDENGEPLSPAFLASQAGVSQDTYSLARAIRSEAGSRSDLERAAVAWCIVNESRRKGRSITQQVTLGTFGGGYFGSQNLGGRYVSTRYAPRTKDLTLATEVLEGTRPDPTNGAVRFFNPSLQDRLVRLGTSKYTKGSQQVLDNWRAEGFEAAPVPGIDPSSFIVFRYVGKGALTS